MEESEGSAIESGVGKGFLLKRKDFLGVDQLAHSHPNRTYYYKKHFDLDEIIATCSKKLSEEPNNVKALFLRGSTLFKKRSFHAALDDFSLILQNEPNHVESLYFRGMSYSKLGQQNQAIEDFSTVLSINSDHVNAAFARAACFNTIGQFSKAIEDYNFALLKDTQNPSPIALTREDRLALLSVSGGHSFKNGGDDGSVGSGGFHSPYASQMQHDDAGHNDGVFSLEKRSQRATHDLSESHRIPPMTPQHGTVTKRPPPAVPQRQNSNAIEGNDGVVLKRSSVTNETLSSPTTQQTDRGSSLLSSNSSNGLNRSFRSDTADEHHSKGYALRRAGDFAGAIAEYSQAIRLDPQHFKAHFNRGFAHDKLGQFAAAVADYSAAADIDPQNAFAYYNRGISNDRMGALDSAIDDFSRAISLQPGTADFYHNRAFCYRKLGRLQEAVDDYTQSLRIAPNHFKALFNRSCCLEQLGALDQALSDVTQALLLQPNHSGCLLNRALLRERVGRLEDSLVDFAQALVHGAEPLQVFLVRPKVLAKLGRYQEAVLDVTAALALQPHGSETAQLLYLRAMCHKSTGDFLRAAADFSAVADLDPANAALAYSHRGFCHRRLERFEEAARDYSEVLRLDPRNVKAHNNRAYVLAKLGRFEAAVADYSAVIASTPDSSHAYHNRGISYDKLGLFDLAIADFTKVLELDSAAACGRSQDSPEVTRRESASTSSESVGVKPEAAPGQGRVSLQQQNAQQKTSPDRATPRIYPVSDKLLRTHVGLGPTDSSPAFKVGNFHVPRGGAPSELSNSHSIGKGSIVGLISRNGGLDKVASSEWTSLGAAPMIPTSAATQGADPANDLHVRLSRAASLVSGFSNGGGGGGTSFGNGGAATEETGGGTSVADIAARLAQRRSKTPTGQRVKQSQADSANGTPSITSAPPQRAHPALTLRPVAQQMEGSLLQQQSTAANASAPSGPINASVFLSKLRAQQQQQQSSGAVVSTPPVPPARLLPPALSVLDSSSVMAGGGAVLQSPLPVTAGAGGPVPIQGRFSYK